MLTDVAVVADATLVFPSVAVMLFVTVGTTVVPSLLAALSVVIAGKLELRGVTGIVVIEGVEDMFPVTSVVVRRVVVTGLEVVVSVAVVMFVISDGCVEVKVVTLVVAVCIAVVVSSVTNCIAALLAGMPEFIVIALLSSEVMTDVFAAGVVTVCPAVMSTTVIIAGVTSLEDKTSSLVVIFGVISASVPRDVVAEDIVVAAVEVIQSVFTPLVVNCDMVSGMVVMVAAVVIISDVSVELEVAAGLVIEAAIAVSLSVVNVSSWSPDLEVAVVFVIGLDVT